MTQTRTPIQVTFSAWKALFLREVIARLAAGRVAWLWLLLEPLAHAVFLMALFGFVLHRVVAGVDGAMFIMTGLLGFFVARNTATRCMDAVTANAALFAYRQVLPVDTVLVRAALEGFLLLISALLLLGGAGLVGYTVLPHDLLHVMLAVAGLWLAGVGLGLVLSVSSELVPEFGKLAHILFRPLYFVSGIMFPASAVPPPYRDWLLLNPFLHGLEILRAGFFTQFHAVPAASLEYLFGFALVTILLGLALHIRFATRLTTQ